MRRLMVLLAALMLPFSVLHADEAKPLADDPAVEARVQKLGEELRCLVCQNQNIADSHADLAMDLKKQLREQIAAGRSDSEIKDFMVERYGDFVLYRPPLKATTVLLWAGPFALLLTVVVLLLRRLRSRAERAAVANTLSADEHERARALLAGEENKV
ncbi:MAG: cytochrome c-type biogenesis protein CcmH [Methyloversatilis discipulorum]|uniref:cytochrome c-type biogenesis protein n=1 Tax=Methyloversatilis discipulorum TaxID=1119528 RepID=UPI0026EEB034|nr:cytochrome c-type biogenesis protein CcmH [Methyloversatilis discipulorum]MBV5285238.1 cytochrome c-type biogenesis protein CcmH [Methyloversatilis discipulorum]